MKNSSNKVLYLAQAAMIAAIYVVLMLSVHHWLLERCRSVLRKH